ncbi:MAG: hypothetical protein DHS20C18_51390 [Saprospiraceae bacterium]|nr:MAG: hypothetical protein DHS20C18_51390 [Saprospiraceae bacterium]
MKELTGSYYQGNYIWGIAMNLAWNELCDKIIGDKVELEDGVGAELVNLFNLKTFDENLIRKDSYLAEAGFGPETARQIAETLTKRFPEKPIDLIENLSVGEEDIICYGYLHKGFDHYADFIETEMSFNGIGVKGFTNKENPGIGVQVVLYRNEDNFILKLLSANEAEEIILIKGFEKNNIQDLIEFLEKSNGKRFSGLNKEDELLIPNIQLQHFRRYEELIGAKLKNKDLIIQIMEEQINFKLDYQGAQVDVEAILVMTRGGFMPKKLILDKPFWLMVKETDKELPYLVLKVENEAILEPIIGS